MIESPKLTNLGVESKRTALQQINPVSYLISSYHNDHPRKLLEIAPPKIKQRLMLTDSGWCRLGTLFVPPNEPVGDWEHLLKILNDINIEAGRPLDSDLIIRSAAYAPFDLFKSKNATRMSEPAYLIANVGKDNKSTRSLATFGKIDLDSSLEEIKRSWLMIHSDNLPLQKEAIHGRLSVRDNQYQLDLGKNLPHARGLENGNKTQLHLPHNSIPFGSSEAFRPTFIAIQEQNNSPLSYQEAGDFLSDYFPAGDQLRKFMKWVKGNLNLPFYTAEFRYYTKGCKPAERFNVMDLNAQF